MYIMSTLWENFNLHMCYYLSKIFGILTKKRLFAPTDYKPDIKKKYIVLTRIFYKKVCFYSFFLFLFVSACIENLNKKGVKIFIKKQKTAAQKGGCLSLGHATLVNF